MPPTAAIRHDWLISVRVGDCVCVHLLSACQVTESEVRRTAIDFALSIGMGNELFIGMRAVDTDPIILSFSEP